MRVPLVSRLRRWVPHTVASVPALDGQVVAAIDRLEELLAYLHWVEADTVGSRPDGKRGLPPPIGDGVAVAAAHAIANALRAAHPDAARPLRPDGCQLVPLSFVTLNVAPVFALGATARVMGSALLPADPFAPPATALPRWLLADSLDRFASDTSDSASIILPAAAPTTTADLVVEVARLHGLLDLPWDDHVARLAAALPAGAGAVRLSPAQHADYQTVTERILRIWHHGDDEAGALYRGALTPP